MYDIKPGAIINADCLTVLRQMNAASVDMIITDPPYGVDYQSTRAAKENRKDKIAGDKSPVIWWIYDAHRVLKEGGGTPVFQPMGCATGVYGRFENRRFLCQVRAGVGSCPPRHGRPQGQFCPSV